MESCALFLLFSKKGKEYFEADSCPSTIGSSISLLLCAITWTIFSQDLLPLRLSLSTNLPSAYYPLLPHFASVANTEPTFGLNTLSGPNLCRKVKEKKEKKIWKTRPGCLDYGSVTVLSEGFSTFWSVTVLGEFCA